MLCTLTGEHCGCVLGQADTGCECWALRVGLTLPEERPRLDDVVVRPGFR